MPFTAAQLENTANAVLDYHMNTPKVIAQTLQDRPLLSALDKVKKSFPGGKEAITVRVKGLYNTGIEGFEADDDVGYDTPEGIKTASYPWRLTHGGIKLTMHELLKDGISIVDTTTGSETVTHSKAEKIQLANTLEEAVTDMVEGTARDRNLMFWRDGTQDAKLVPGIRSFILDDPTSSVIVGGIDQSANDWWRNRAKLGISVTTPGDGELVNALQTEWRQLRRFGGRPNLVLCGSDWLTAHEKTLRAMGTLTDTGWTLQKNTDASIADVYFKGVKFEYDPTLDDEELSKYCFVMDTRHIKPRFIEGEDAKRHNPARPATKYVLYRALTWAEGLSCDQRNCHGVYSIN